MGIALRLAQPFPSPYSRTFATALAALVALLTACSSNVAKPERSKASNSSQTKPTATPPRPLALGKVSKWEGEFEGRKTSVTTTAATYAQPVAKGSVQPDEEFGTDNADYVWVALEVKVCNKEGADVHVNDTPWSLAYADGARVQPSGTTYSDFPKPEYPIGDTLVRAGDCVRGKIVFPVPGDQRPERVVYAPQDGDVLEWAVPST